MNARYDERQAELLAALKAEEAWSSTYLRSELENAQIDALKRFYGDEYGDEVEGRSRVTTREVYETIQWLRPDLRRTFTAGDQVFEFEGVTPEADQHAKAATDYVNYIFLVDNEGERELDAFIFDGLLQRRGVMACEWKEAEYAAEQEVSGLNTLQVQQLMQDQRTEIVAQEVRQDMPDEAHPDGLYFDLKIRKRKADARPEVFTIAPEDFRIAARCVDLENARYAGDLVRMMAGEAKRKWPDYAEEIDAGGHSDEWAADERRAERFRDVEGWDAGKLDDQGQGEAQEVEIMREFIRFDLNGDGFPELIRVYRLGDCILESEEVDEHIYASWTPNPIPHRFYGLSVADECADIQRTKTVLLRSALDSVYQNVAPRLAYDKAADVDLDALLTVRPGVAIGVNGNPSDKVFPITVPDMSVNAFQAMQVIDRMLESRTGVTRQAQGMDPDILHDTAKGVELLQNAQSVRKEEIARNLALGLQDLGMKLFRMVHKHQNEARAVKIANQWRNVDPRTWEADLRCTVSVGLGTGAKEKQLLMLQMIQADQIAVVGNYGAANPSVGMGELYATVTEKLRVMGFKSPDKFFKPPVNQDGTPWVPEPQPSPDQQKVQAQIQEGQARLQMDAQKAQMDAGVKQYETQAKAQADVQKAQLDAEIARMKAEAEIALAAQKMQMEMALKERQMQFEMQMQERQFAFESQQAAKETDAKIEVMEKQASAKAKANGSSGVSKTQFGGDPG